ncbi:CHASE3 domain-containing protein [uncultured Algimonas sp.]|uniref:sensor histidine kinase n=1 Tax=uncultured Algimonas sp. TaxID=1547920 RepID=UPI002623B2FC|nr:CHASE3 domain-containing protein [uncultured Algimonas sp.]
MGSTRLIGILATLVAILIAAVAGTALYTSVRFADAEREARTAIAEATAYSRVLDRLKDAVLDAETGQRGYLLTGERDYLIPYVEARALMGDSIDDGWVLQALRGGEDEELRRLIDFKMTELDEVLRLFDSGNPNAALSMVQTDRGRELMRDIRIAIRIRQSEAQALADTAAARSQNYSDRSGVVSTLLAALLGLATLMGAVTLYLWSRTDRAVAEAEEATDTAERIEIVARELNHRMKNLFAVAQGMLRQSARGRGEGIERFADEASARITAMSHAYSATRDLGDQRTLSSDELFDRVVRVQLLDGHRLRTSGASRDLPEEAITPLALILHEWTTNALKYGAWKEDATPTPEAQVTVTLGETPDGDLELLWDERSERRGLPVPEGRGYGSKLIKACAAQLGGSVDYDWHDEGVRIRLTADAARLAVVPQAEHAD